MSDCNYIDELIPRYEYTLSFLSPELFGDSLLSTSFHYFNNQPEKNFRLQVGHTYIFRIYDQYYGIRMKSDGEIALFTSDPKKLESELFQQIFGSDYFTAEFHEFTFVPKLDDLEQKLEMDMAMKFMLIWQFDTIALIDWINIMKQIRKYCYHIPYITVEKQVQSQLSEMVQDLSIGNEECYGPLLLYKHGALTHADVKKISNATIFTSYEQFSDPNIDLQYGLFATHAHFTAFEITSTEIIFHDSIFRMPKDIIAIFIKNNISKQPKFIAYCAQIDGKSCAIYATFYYFQLLECGYIKHIHPTFNFVDGINRRLLEK